MKKGLLSFLSALLYFSGTAQPLGFNKGWNQKGYITTETDSTSTRLINLTGYKCIKIQADGKAVLGGREGNGQYSGTLMRYLTDGTPDNSFGNKGVVSVNYFPVADMVIQADGKIVVGGVVFAFGKSEFTLARYNSNGTVDSSFNGAGRMRAQFGYFRGGVSALALDNDQKIVAVGSTDTFFVSLGYSYNVFGVMRVNTNGTIDNTFGNNGSATFRIGTQNDGATAVAVQSDNKIVVGGQTQGPGFIKFAALRLLPNGTLDNTFDGDGILIDNFSTNANLYDIAVRPNGKIIACGNSFNGSIRGVALVQYNTDGTRDLAFDGDGVATSGTLVSGSRFRMVLLPNGNTLVGGQNDGGGSSNNRVLLMLFNTTGGLDVSLNGTGYIFSNYQTNNFDQPEAVAAFGNDKFYSAGNRYGGSLNYYAMAKYNGNGSRDLTFNTTGVVIKRTTGCFDRAGAIAIQPDGKIITAGESSWTQNTPGTETSTNQYFTKAVRYKADGTIDSTFGTNGITTIGAFGTINAIVVQPDGKILLGGGNNSYTIIRINANGSLDNTFGSNGAFIQNTTGSGYNTGVVKDIALQADGKIITVATSLNYSTSLNNLVVTRLSANGALDAPFNNKVISRGTAQNDIGNCIALQADGKMLVGGGLYVYKLKANGTFDSTFGNVNFGISSSGTNGDINSVKVLADGKIIAGGWANPSAYDSDMALYRFTATGILDVSFGNAGKTITSLPSFAQEVITDVFPQSNGTILTSGYGLNGIDRNNVILARYTAAGVLDNSFGTNGIYSPDLENGSDDIVLDALQSGTKMFVGGYFRNNNQTDFLVASFDVLTTPLPIRLGTFLAIKKSATEAQLNWNTITESNTNRFEVERSPDGIHYVTIGTVYAMGNSSANVQYTYTDKNVLKGANFYRLKQMDNDSKFTFTPTRSLFFNGELNIAIKLYPNPASDFIIVDVPASLLNKALHISLTNTEGKIVRQWSIASAQGLQLQLSLNALANGSYILNYKSTTMSGTQKLIVQ